MVMRSNLTPTEFACSRALVARSEVLERRALLAPGWPEERDPDPEWLKAHLARLRRNSIRRCPTLAKRAWSGLPVGLTARGV